MYKYIRNLRHNKILRHNIKKLGYKDDDFFKIIDKLSYEIYDQNLAKPTEMEHNEYLIVPKNFNLKKFINDC